MPSALARSLAQRGLNAPTQGDAMRAAEPMWPYHETAPLGYGSTYIPGTNIPDVGIPEQNVLQPFRQMLDTTMPLNESVDPNMPRLGEEWMKRLLDSMEHRQPQEQNEWEGFEGF